VSTQRRRDGLATHGRTHERDDFPESLALQPMEAEGCGVLDISMPGMNGLDLHRKMNAPGISLPVMFLTGHGDIPMTVHALKAGAVHFLTKPEQEDELLSSRERQVMQLAASGRLNKEIAHELGVRERTIKLHRGHESEKRFGDAGRDGRRGH
jgi:FixJ family two-component response regulator